MGQAPSFDEPVINVDFDGGRASLPSLDALRGYNRPTVKLRDTLSTQFEWLGENLQQRLSELEVGTTHAGGKEALILSMSGPDSKQRLGFGTSSEKGGPFGSDSSSPSRAPAPLQPPSAYLGPILSRSSTSTRETRRNPRHSFGSLPNNSSLTRATKKERSIMDLSSLDIGRAAKLEASSSGQATSPTRFRPPPLAGEHSLPVLSYQQPPESTLTTRGSEAGLGSLNAGCILPLIRSGGSGGNYSPNLSKLVRRSLTGQVSQSRSEGGGLLSELEASSPSPSASHTPSKSAAASAALRRKTLMRRSILAEGDAGLEPGTVDSSLRTSNGLGGPVMSRLNEASGRVSDPGNKGSGSPRISRQQDVPRVSPPGLLPPMLHLLPPMPADARVTDPQASRRISNQHPSQPPRMTLEQLHEEEKGMHWRLRLWKAKKRLYLYLRVYSRWMLILKRLRKGKGFADPIPTPALSLLLLNKLGLVGPTYAIKFLDQIETWTKASRGVEESVASDLTALLPQCDTPHSSNFRLASQPSRLSIQDSLGLSDDLSTGAQDATASFKAQDAAASLKVIGSRANALFVEAQQQASTAGSVAWPRAPHVIHQSSDVVDYNSSLLPSLLAHGKLAVQIIDSGEMQVTGEALGEDGLLQEQLEPLLSVDLWQAVDCLFPLTVGGLRLNKLTSLDRLVLSNIVSVEKMAGSDAVSLLSVILCVESSNVRWVVQQCISRSHWGLSPKNVIIVPIPKMPALTWDPATRSMIPSLQLSCGGSGLAMLGLNLPSEAFYVEPPTYDQLVLGTYDPDGQRRYLDGSVLQKLRQQKVERIFTIRATDYSQLLSDSPLDNSFLNIACNSLESNDANMAMEVLEVENETEMRQIGNIVVASSEASQSTNCLRTSSLQTVQGRMIPCELLKTGFLLCANQRYLFNVSALSSLLTGHKAIGTEVNVSPPSVQLVFHMEDLANNQESRCIAVLGIRKERGGHLGLVIGKEALSSLSTNLFAQDNHAQFKQRAIAALSRPSKAAPPGLSSQASFIIQDANRPMLSPEGSMTSFRSSNHRERDLTRLGGPGLLPLLSSPSSNSMLSERSSMMGSLGGQSMSVRPRRGVRCLLFVNTTNASRMAFRLLQSLMGREAGDQIEVVFIHQPRVGFSHNLVSAEVNRLVESFASPLFDHLISRRVVTQSLPLMEQFSSLVDECAPDLVVVGSEVLSSSVSNSSLSISLALAKMSLKASLLIVKTNSSGDALKMREGDKTSPSPLCLACNVAPSSTHMLDWMLNRLTPSRDRVVFFRSRGAGDGEAQQAFTTRLLTSYEGEAKKLGMPSSRHVLTEGPLSNTLPPILAKEKVDLIVLQSTAEGAIDLLKVARASMLLYRAQR